MIRIVVALAVVALVGCGSGGTGGSGGSSAGGGTGGATGGGTGGATGGGTGGATGGGTGGATGGGTGGATGGGTGGATGGGTGGATGGGTGGAAGGGTGGGAFDAGPFLMGTPMEEHVGDGNESTWIQLGSDGQPRIAWNRQVTGGTTGTLYFSTRSAAGVWAAQAVDTNIPGRGVGENVHFVLDGTGKPHLLYRAITDGGTPITTEVRYATFDGANWLVERPQLGGVAALSMDIRLGSDGQPRIVYGLFNAASTDAGVTDGGGPRDTVVVYSTRNSAGTWTPQEMDRSPFRTAANNNFGRGLTMVLDTQGNAHAFYEARMSEDGGVPNKDSLRHSTNASGGWAADTVYAGPGIGTDVVFGNAAMGPAGVVWVAASGGSGAFVFRQGLGGTWVNTTGNRFYPAINYFRLALSSNAIPWGAAVDTSTNNRRLLVWRDPPGMGPVQSSIASPGQTTVPGLTLDSNSRPHLSFTQTNGDAGTKYVFYP